MRQSHIRIKLTCLDKVEELTYLGNAVSTTGGTDQILEARLGKARSTFQPVDRLWKSQDNLNGNKSKDIQLQCESSLSLCI